MNTMAPPENLHGFRGVFMVNNLGFSVAQTFIFHGFGGLMVCKYICYIYIYLEPQ